MSKLLDYVIRERQRHDSKDDVEMDEWMNMSEKEQDRLSQSVNREYDEMLAQMTPLQLYRYSRRFNLVSILLNRQRLKDPRLNTIAIINKMWTRSIRKSQLRLVQIRSEYYHNQQIGRA